MSELIVLQFVKAESPLVLSDSNLFVDTNFVVH